MLFDFNVPSFLSNIMLQRMASCTQTDELGERKEQQGQKMLECLVFIGTFSPGLQGSRLELKTQKPLMDNLWWNPDEGSKEGALCALSLIVDVWLCGPRFWTKTPPAKSGSGWIWQVGWGAGVGGLATIFVRWGWGVGWVRFLNFPNGVEMTLGQVLELMTKIYDWLTKGELGFKEEDGGGDPPWSSPTYLLKWGWGWSGCPCPSPCPTFWGGGEHFWTRLAGGWSKGCNNLVVTL